MAVTKADLAKAIYPKHESMTKRDAVEAMESFLRLSKSALIGGHGLLLTNFSSIRDIQKKGQSRIIISQMWFQNPGKEEIGLTGTSLYRCKNKNEENAKKTKMEAYRSTNHIYPVWSISLVWQLDDVL